ncbi:hypothetical protein ACFQ10_41150 [Streptomyces indonesiensis]
MPYEPASFDRIVATVSVRTIPAGWLRVLRPGGRLVTTIAGTSLLVTAEKDEDGGATGRVEWDRAGFMHARHGDDYPPGAAVRLAKAAELDGDEVTSGPYPVVDVANAWDLASMLDIEAPGIEHDFREDGAQRVALMAHADGSWARATATGNERPTVHQGGPRGCGTPSTRSATTGSATASYRCEGPAWTSCPTVVRSSAAGSGPSS